jgi:hypothetical protein
LHLAIAAIEESWSKKEGGKGEDVWRWFERTSKQIPTEGNNAAAEVQAVAVFPVPTAPLQTIDLPPPEPPSSCSSCSTPHVFCARVWKKGTSPGTSVYCQNPHYYRAPVLASNLPPPRHHARANHRSTCD